ncbi:hypothetical protein [Zoogloea sp. 1C4]|uniref:hypothetical protein n=1 Tax=Zoogloea sp. 1C4 TaxID=2570190 RepID=UPI001291A5A3|nr:hypothetical protein [Zoogloea sp. 1C4]
MSAANVRLQLQFDLELAVPASVAALDHARLCQKLAELLGPTVIQGLPVIAGKQLAKAEVRVVKHHHRLDAVARAVARIEPARIVEAAPHLTDAEVATLAARAAARLPAGEADQAAYLRSQALALVNEYRLVGCRVDALLSNGKPTQIEGKLNLTNGHIFLDASHRQTRLQQAQGPLRVAVGETDVVLAAECSGHTLTGPVLDVAVKQLVPHRAALLARWQAG